MKRVLKVILIVVGIAAVVGGIWAGYRYAPDWTGFGEYQTPSEPDVERARRLWDWLELLIVPFVLALGVWWLDRRQKKMEREFEQARLEKDREIAREKRQDATLEAYFDRMAALLLEEGLRDSEAGDEVRKIARTRTLAVVRRLDGKRKAEVVRFLHEAELIQVDSPIVSLRGADLSGAGLYKADLRGTNLRGAGLWEANLGWALLRGADLSGANLRGADLSESDLGRANLREAFLGGADLQGADLQGADLQGVNLVGAFLREANLFEADLREADLREADLQWARHLGEADFEDAQLEWAKVLVRDVKRLKRAGASLEGAEVVDSLSL